ncbi:MAG: hypothetical protein ACREXY_22810, partial [Gammaproteobacteria bacterium]
MDAFCDSSPAPDSKTLDCTETDDIWTPLRLKKGEDRRLRAGHLWVFSNEIDTSCTPISGLSPGQPVAVQD